jgi:hypothetical protein
MMIRVFAALLMLAAPAFAQDATPARVMSAVQSAMKSALPYPDTDRSGAVPADGKTEPLWMVRRPEPDEQAIEVIANPLNDVNQQRAARAMAQIQNNIESAQRKAAAQYERAVAEAKRTGKSQEVDGVTLSDEGVAGAKIDADSHVVIDVAFNQPSYTFTVSSAVQPAASTQVSIPGAAAVIAVPANTYRDARLEADRYAEAETLVFLGRIAAPEVQKRADHAYEVMASVTPTPGASIATLVLHFRGNELLIADLLRKTDWPALLELIK